MIFGQFDDFWQNASPQLCVIIFLMRCKVYRITRWYQRAIIECECNRRPIIVLIALISSHLSAIWSFVAILCRTMPWDVDVLKSKKYQKILLSNTYMGMVAYHFAFIIGLLAVTFQLTPFQYSDFMLMLAFLYPPLIGVLIVIFRVKEMSLSFSNRVFLFLLFRQSDHNLKYQKKLF